jgi:hypothetical protein
MIGWNYPVDLGRIQAALKLDPNPTGIELNVRWSVPANTTSLQARDSPVDHHLPGLMGVHL